MPESSAPLSLETRNILGRRSGVQTEIADWNGQEVFVKTLLTTDAETVMRFHHEGQISDMLSHPNILPLMERTSSQLIFPSVKGPTLRERIASYPMTVPETLQVTACLVEALIHLHSRQVVHHDLKPENVMLRGGEITPESVLLIDFGMAHARALPRDVHSSTRLGTPHFMALEQFLGIRGDPRSDLYSLGVLIYDCLVGHPPYEDALGWLVGVPQPQPKCPQPEALQPLLCSLLQRQPDERPASAQAVKDELIAIGMWVPCATAGL